MQWLKNMKVKIGMRTVYYLSISTLSIALIAIDQFSKYFVRLRRLADGGFYVCNSNISWNIPVNVNLFMALWIILIFALIFLLFRKSMVHNSFFLILILSGAISNVVDRIRFGCVVDFIDLKFWPVFNLADVFIFLGAVFLLVKRKKV
jgi:signal peptidase II